MDDWMKQISTRKHPVNQDMWPFAGRERTSWWFWGTSEFDLKYFHWIIWTLYFGCLWLVLSSRGSQGSQALREHQVWEWVSDCYALLFKDIHLSHILLHGVTDSQWVLQMSLHLSSGFTRAQWISRGKGETESIRWNYMRSREPMGVWSHCWLFHNVM